MEGYLSKKGRGESNSIFSRSNWKKRWFILDGGYLTYYENFDKTKNEAVNKKGTVPVIGCQLVRVGHSDREFVFAIKHATRKIVNLCAENEQTMNIWIKALIRASSGIMGPSVIDFSEYFSVLELDKNEILTVSSLNKTFRKKALKSHPDKGGSVEEFKIIQSAFEMLMSKLEDEESAKHFTTVEVR